MVEGGGGFTSTTLHDPPQTFTTCRRKAARGRQASTGLARVLLRAQVLSHLVNQLGLYTSQL